MLTTLIELSHETILLSSQDNPPLVNFRSFQAREILLGSGNKRSCDTSSTRVTRVDCPAFHASSTKRPRVN